ncbi:MAG: MgtC/SapB family protein [Gemmatimonadota bacterium]
MADVFASLQPQWLNLLARLGLALLLGGVIGLERELSGKPAGLRTNLLICVGAALLTDLSLVVAQRAHVGANADPARIAAQVVSGIGFLGAGTIIQARGGVMGLTTAATLWVVAAIGMAAGAGAYGEAVGTTAVVMVVLVVLGRVEMKLLPEQTRVLQVSAAAGREVVAQIEEILTDAGLDYDVVDIHQDDGHISVSFEATGRGRAWRGVTERIAALDGVHRVSRP